MLSQLFTSSLVTFMFLVFTDLPYVGASLQCSLIRKKIFHLTGIPHEHPVFPPSSRILGNLWKPSCARFSLYVSTVQNVAWKPSLPNQMARKSELVGGPTAETDTIRHKSFFLVRSFSVYDKPPIVSARRLRENSRCALFANTSNARRAAACSELSIAST